MDKKALENYSQTSWAKAGITDKRFMDIRPTLEKVGAEALKLNSKSEIVLLINGADLTTLEKLVFAMKMGEEKYKQVYHPKVSNLMEQLIAKYGGKKKK